MTRPLPDLPGIRVRNPEGGTSPSFLYLHGAMGQKDLWLACSREVVRREPDRRGILMDLAGHGEACGTTLDTLADYATDVVRRLDALGVDRVIAVGHSMGGGIIQEMARAFPDRVAGVVLVSCGLRFGVRRGLGEGLPLDMALIAEFFRFFAFGEAAPEALRTQALEPLRAAGPEVADRDFAACRRFDSAPWAAQITVPVRVLVGAQDRMTPPALCRELADALGTPLVEIPGAGHMLPLEAPDLLAANILELTHASLGQTSPAGR